MLTKGTGSSVLQNSLYRMYNKFLFIIEWILTLCDDILYVSTDTYYESLPLAHVPCDEQLFGHVSAVSVSRTLTPLEVLFVCWKLSSRDAVVTHFFFSVSRVAFRKSTSP